jgi:formylmethanofuran dehydrogenase subunit E
MKRKIQPKEDAIVPVEILDTSHTFFVKEKVRRAVPCSVCGSETTDELLDRDSNGHLCWVCRRLKISAWRDSEQLPAQE